MMEIEVENSNFRSNNNSGNKLFNNQFDFLKKKQNGKIKTHKEKKVNGLEKNGLKQTTLSFLSKFESFKFI